MSRINKPRLVFCTILSILASVYWYLDFESTHQRFKNSGVITVVYIKDAAKNEVTWSQRFKYTWVAKLYFVTSKGDTIRDFTKNRWAVETKELKDLPLYLPLDSVVYDKNNPKDFQFIAEYRNYSPLYNGIMYFIFSPLFFTAWTYIMLHFLDKLYMLLKGKRITH
jgi:hypothetical protein